MHGLGIHLTLETINFYVQEDGEIYLHIFSLDSKRTKGTERFC